MADSPTSGYAEINGTRLYYEVAGSGRPLILLHEGIANLHFWDDQWDALAGEFRIVRYDLRGFGKSVMPAGPFNMRDDLYQLMRFLGIERAALMGASVGGSIVIDFTLEHPEMVDALIPVAAGLSGTPQPTVEQMQAWGVLELWGAVQAAQQAGDRDREDELSLQVWVDGPRRTPEAVNPTVRARVAQMLRDNRAAEAGEGSPVRLDPPASGRLGEIHVPALVIVGDEDIPMILETADTIAQGIPGARKVIMHDVAHALNMERPEEFNRIVLDFLRGV